MDTIRLANDTGSRYRFRRRRGLASSPPPMSWHYGKSAAQIAVAGLRSGEASPYGPVAALLPAGYTLTFGRLAGRRAAATIAD